MRILTLSLLLGAPLPIACGAGDNDTGLSVSWSFDSGDCDTNGVKTVRVTWGPSSAPTQSREFACKAGQGTLGSISEGVDYSITAVGLDAGGNDLVESYPVSTSFSGNASAIPIDLEFHPKPIDVSVTWSFADGSTCPPGVILPYFVTIYQAPATAGGTPETEVAETQMSCVAGRTTIPRIAPGNYVVQLDSRAITPAVKATAKLTVKSGEAAAVALLL